MCLMNIKMTMLIRQLKHFVEVKEVWREGIERERERSNFSLRKNWCFLIVWEFVSLSKL